jgi:RHS repeat-associated protein
MLRRLLTLLTVLTLACASAQAYVPERSLLHQSELASPAKTAPRGFAATAATAAKEKSRASDCCIRENWRPPLKLASSMQFTGHYREREGSSYYAQQRYYRPGIGRFNRIDPWEGDVLRPITLNKYLYAAGNPLRYVDPDGRRPCDSMQCTLLQAQSMADSTADKAAIAGLMERNQQTKSAAAPLAVGVMAMPLLAPLAAEAGGVWAATLAAARLGGWRWGVATATTRGAPLAETVLTTGAAVATGAEVPSLLNAPMTVSRRLASGLDAGLDVAQPLQRVVGQTPSGSQASALSSSAATNRVVQQAQPVMVVEGGNGQAAQSMVQHSDAARRPGGYQSNDVDPHGLLSPQSNRAPGHTNTRDDRFVQSHHPIQDRWAAGNVPGYQRDRAPAVLLESISGAAHAQVSAAQRQRRAAARSSGADPWGTDIRSEFNISYREMIDAGVPESVARRAFRDSYKYFDELGAFE